MNGGVLATATLLTSFICMAVSLWLSMYLLSRSFSNPLTFRAVTALLSLALFFFYSAAEITNQIDTSVERSLVMLITLIAGHDLTHYMLPLRQRRQLYWVARSIVLLGLPAIVLLFSAPPTLPCSPLAACPASFQMPWVLVDLFKLIILAAYLYNLWIIRKSEAWLRHGGSLAVLLLASSPLLYSLLSAVLGLNLPRLGINLLMLAALLLLTFTVSRDRTLLSQRRAVYDLPLTLLTILLITGLYAWVSIEMGLPAAEIMLLLVLAIFTHAAYDLVREFLERLFRRQEQQVRQELRDLARDAASEESQTRLLRRGLAVIASSMNASAGLIALNEGEGYRVAASLKAVPKGEWLTSAEASQEHSSRHPTYLRGQPYWLVPVWSGSQQVAVIALGERKDRLPYTEENLLWVEDIADVIGALAHGGTPFPSQAGETSPEGESGVMDPAGLDSAAGELLARLAYNPDPQLLRLVEDGFHNLKDYSWLGRSALPELLGIQGENHIDCGKQVQAYLTQAVSKLRPTGPRPPEPQPREWYAYAILHGAYVEEKPTREITAALFISDGTYYRLRRQALRGFTRALLEMRAASALPSQ